MKGVDVTAAAALVVEGLGCCVVGLLEADVVSGLTDLSSGLGRGA